ncbi:hypothetical protein EI981_27150 [Paenibacillus lutimineralis]|uniref:Polysaccharide chain length determinant N-terminal domain-containing protein n=2 Tax=Paenibacillus lutimineralis TaxID=2707005 RepID=A0A3Q9ICS8_9BACL|nr:hypothetical protein EI981_27150 [Paenibacillus lutimineralis]
MDLSYLFKSVRKHMIAFLITLLICVGGVFLLNAIVKPQYQATASLVATLASAESGTYNDFLASQALTKTYEDAIQSRYIANEAKKKLNTKETAYELLERVKVRTDPGTLVIILYAKHDHPQEAVDIANSFADAFIEKSTDIVPNANVIVLDYANMEDASIPVSPRKMLNLAIGTFIGFFAGLVIVLYLERKRGSRRRPLRHINTESM